MRVWCGGKQLSLIGEPDAVLDGNAGPRATGLVIHRANVEVQGVTFTGFKFDVEEDEIYDSRVRVRDVTIEKYRTMGLTGRGTSDLDAANLRIVDGHVAIWLDEHAHVRLEGKGDPNFGASIGLRHSGRLPSIHARMRAPGPTRPWAAHAWKGGRVVDCTGLENRQALTSLVGSNPTPSANKSVTCTSAEQSTRVAKCTLSCTPLGYAAVTFATSASSCSINGVIESLF